MEYGIAVCGIRETARILKQGALMYIDLIMPTDEREAFEETVSIEHEHGTIQSYFTPAKMHDLLDAYFTILQFKVITWSDENKVVTARRAHLVCERK